MKVAAATAPEVIAVGRATLIAAAAAIGGFLFGYDSAVINGAVPGIQATFKTGSGATGFAVASILIGCALGALFAGRAADLLGRRPLLLATGVVFAASSVWTGFVGSETTFNIARFVGGLAVGAASVVSPAYIAEISPASIRGRLTALNQMGIVVGIFMSLLVDYAIARAAGGPTQLLWWGLEAWRWMFLSEALPSLALVVAAFAIPESPRYLVAIGQEDRALAVMRSISPSVGADAIEAIRRSFAGERKPRFADLLGPGRRLLPIVWVGIALSCLQQFVGINVIFYYGTTLWQAVGFSDSDSLLINVISSTINVAATLIAIALIDHVGRRPLLLWGAVGMAMTLGLLALMFATASTGVDGKVTLAHPYAVTALIAANLFVLAFGISWGPAVWTMLSEMFPNRMRGSALAVAVTAQWLANWSITVTFPWMLKHLGSALAYAVYAGFAAIAIVFVARYVRETRGRTLEEM